MYKLKNYLGMAALFLAVFSLSSCNKIEEIAEIAENLPFRGVFKLEDQMARPAINTVFVSSDRKDEFNVTPPSMMGEQFASAFNDRLLALNPGYTTNLLGLDAATFTSVLASDVLTVSTVGPTTFFDGVNVLTGRALADDVIDVELILIFGGPDGAANPGLTSDNVDANDKPFATRFPYLASPW